MEIVLAKEAKRIAEDMQLRDLKVNKILFCYFYVNSFSHFQY
jgi:hypothetical protein